MQAQPPRLVRPIGHTGAVRMAQFSPDGKKVVTASLDYTAKIWDANTGLLLADLKGHTNDLVSAKWSPDGTRIVTASYDHTAKIWDVRSGTLLADLTGHTQLVRTAEFSPDGKKLVTTARDGRAKIWDASTGKPLIDLSGDTAAIRHATFSPDGKKIITMAYGKTARIVDAVTGLPILLLEGHSDSLVSAEFSPDGTKAITAALDSTARIWDAATGRSMVVIKEPAGKMDLARFTPDGRSVFTISSEGILRIWDAERGRLLTSLPGDSSRIYMAGFSPDGRRIVTTDNDDEPLLWDAASGQLIARLQGHDHFAFVLSVAFSPLGDKVVSASSDSTAKIWDARSGKLLADLKGHTSWPVTAGFNPDGDRIVTGSWDRIGRVWNVANGDMTALLKGHTKWIAAAWFSSDGKKIFTRALDFNVRVWNAADGNEMRRFRDRIGEAALTSTGDLVTISLDDTIRVRDPVTGGMVVPAAKYPGSSDIHSLSLDGKRIAVPSGKTSVTISDLPTGKKLLHLSGHSAPVSCLRFSPDGNLLATCSDGDSTFRIWDTHTGRSLLRVKEYIFGSNNLFFSPDGRQLITRGYDAPRIWDTRTGALLLTLDKDLVSYEYSPDGRRLVVASEINDCRILDSRTGATLVSLTGHANLVNSAHFSKDGKKLVTASVDNTCKVWDAATGRLIYTFFSVDSADYFMQVPSGYYKCTPNAARLLHYVTRDLKTLTFEQLDIRYNRPDKVLEAIGNRDQALIGSYRKAYDKRIRRLGIDTASFRDGFSVPEADFANRDQLDHAQNNPSLSLHMTGVDSAYLLDRFNIWVNDVPVYGVRGASPGGRTHTLDTTVTVTLSEGENKIEGSIRDKNGIESYRMPLYVNYTPALPYSPKTVFIGIGIDAFADPGYNLQWSRKDIRDLARQLAAKYAGRSPATGATLSIDTLFDQAVTVDHIRALKKKLLETHVDDKVIIAYSGHGQFSKDYDYYLSTYNIDFNRPEENGLPYDQLESLLDSIPARKKLLLIDACHSGEIDKEEMQRYRSVQARLDTSIIARGIAKGIIPVGKDRSRVGMRNSFDLMRDIFVNVSKSTGATVLSAASGTQFALEKNRLRNGVFTYSILEYMQQRQHASLSGLKAYVERRVPVLTEGLQVPTARTETTGFDWELW